MILRGFNEQEEQIYPSILGAQHTPYFSSFNSPVILESPESILAKSNPKETLRLLENISLDNYRSRLNEIGSSVINTYLNRLTSEDTSGLKECEFQEIKRRNVFGVVTERGMKFTFKR